MCYAEKSMETRDRMPSQEELIKMIHVLSTQFTCFGRLARAIDIDHRTLRRFLDGKSIQYLPMARIRKFVESKEKQG